MADDKKTGAVSMELPGVDFAAIVKQVIAMKVTEGLMGAEGTVQKLVVAALAEKVDNEGKLTTYSHYGNQTWVEWQMKELLKIATKNALQEKVDEMKPRLEKAVATALRENVEIQAGALVATFIDEIKESNYRNLVIEVGLKKKAKERF